jgi:hypothetical protein
LVKVFVVLGLALLAGGAYAIVDGWPYRVLERGFTEVILGGLSAVAGLILLALAAVLAEMRRLKGLVSGAMAVAALSEPRSNERPVPDEALARLEPVLEKEHRSEAGHIGIATTLAAGAGAAAVAGALTSLAKADEPVVEKPSDKPDAADKTDDGDGGDGMRSDHAETVAVEPQQPPPVVAGGVDDWLLPSIPVALDAAPSEVRSDERDESDEAEGKVEASEEDEQDRLVSASVDEPSRLESDDEERDDAKPVMISADETEAKQAQDEGETAKQETASESAEDRLWWPRIDRPLTEATASIDDEFTALRDQLSGVVNAPEVELPQRDRGGLGGVESWVAPRAWPPVTQPRDPGALGDVEADAGDKVSLEQAESEPVATDSEPVVPAVEQQEEAPAPEPTSAEAQAPSMEEAVPAAETRPDEEPAASEEGVIGAYQVGETQFTMFADGSIHARTPDGDYTFASMDELKAYLATEKDKLEPSSN